MRARYAILFVVLVLIQTQILDMISMSKFVVPVIYIIYIILLPTDNPPKRTLLAAFLMGAVMDAVTGEGGLNTIATLAAGYLQPTLLRMVCGEDIMRERSIPSVHRFGFRRFCVYAGSIIFIHAAVFFTLELMDMAHARLILLRILCSGAATLILCILISSIFNRRQPWDTGR